MAWIEENHGAYRITWRDEQGKKQHTQPFPTREAAEAAKPDIERKTYRKQLIHRIDSVARPLDQIVADWLNSLPIAPITKASYERSIFRAFLEFFAGHSISTITRQDTDDIMGEALPHTRVEMKSGDKTFASVTNSEGDFTFYGIPEGKYRFAADLPEHFEFAMEILGGPLPSPEIPKNACIEYGLSALPTGRIRGRVLGSDGKPLVYASVDLYRREKYGATEYTSEIWSASQDHEKTYFEFQNAGPGDYIVVYNDNERLDADTPYPRAFYPGVTDLKSAKTIHLELGEKFDNADINLSGGRPTRVITVRLVGHNHQLPNIKYVEGTGSDGTSTTEEEVTNGVYLISILKDVQYTFRGQGHCSVTGKGSTTKPMRVAGSDESTREITLNFLGPGCPEKTAGDSK